MDYKPTICYADYNSDYVRAFQLAMEGRENSVKLADEVLGDDTMNE